MKFKKPLVFLSSFKELSDFNFVSNLSDYETWIHPEFTRHPARLNEIIEELQKELKKGKQIVLYTHSDWILQYLNNAITRQDIHPEDVEGYEYFQNGNEVMKMTRFGLDAPNIQKQLIELQKEIEEIKNLTDDRYWHRVTPDPTKPFLFLTSEGDVTDFLPILNQSQHELIEYPEFGKHPTQLKAVVSEFQAMIDQGRRIAVYTQSDWVISYVNLAIARAVLKENQIDVGDEIVFDLDTIQGYECLDGEVCDLEIGPFGWEVESINRPLRNLMIETYRIQNPIG